MIPNAVMKTTIIDAIVMEALHCCIAKCHTLLNLIQDEGEQKEEEKRKSKKHKEEKKTMKQEYRVKMTKKR